MCEVGAVVHVVGAVVHMVGAVVHVVDQQVHPSPPPAAALHLAAVSAALTEVQLDITR